MVAGGQGSARSGARKVTKKKFASKRYRIALLALASFPVVAILCGCTSPLYQEEVHFREICRKLKLDVDGQNPFLASEARYVERELGTKEIPKWNGLSTDDCDSLCDALVSYKGMHLFLRHDAEVIAIKTKVNDPDNKIENERRKRYSLPGVYEYYPADIKTCPWGDNYVTLFGRQIESKYCVEIRYVTDPETLSKIESLPLIANDHYVDSPKPAGFLLSSFSWGPLVTVYNSKGVVISKGLSAKLSVVGQESCGGNSSLDLQQSLFFEKMNGEQ